MSEHYYSQKPSVESDRKTWSFRLREKDFVFQSDRGVFSKKEVDFGSQLLIETFESPAIQGDFLDAGCGYGPIGLSIAASFPDRTVEMIDINERAVELSKANAGQNQISNVSIYQSDLFEKVPAKKFAAVLTNPPIRAGKQTVHEIFEKSYEHLLPGGELWVVIQKKQGAPSAFDKIEELFGEAFLAVKSKGYHIIRAKK
ncbi:class I SAM-dependent methyltransferase [Metabacillus sp. GX 13764]|uniref:class I SAM-dependent methyltransferase n=1 Tax=Metabacillus kandeliae TaxID=2900151 RepID=UPI001E64654F|nr:class I SAM-dependent methyltransferase [Metabacillus kandeliae]MCD7036569.1 class I SAM-dependent methyltransferase [Metabacillus kandeliae]